MLRLRYAFVLFLATLVIGFPKNLKFKGHGENIVGGKEAKVGQFPYQAEIFLKSIKIHHCGGAILNKRWILTAAHCIDEYEPEDFIIKLGSILQNSNFTTYSLSKIIPHPSYNSSTKQNDLALLLTPTPIKYSPTIQPIPLSNSSPPPNSDVIASGWGYLAWESDAPIPNELHYVNLKVIANQKCELMMKTVNVVTDKQICTLKSRVGVCGGDSGGPLVYKGKLVGVVSWGVPCGAGFPDVFTNVAGYLNWIKKNIK